MEVPTAWNIARALLEGLVVTVDDESVTGSQRFKRVENTFGLWAVEVIDGPELMKIGERVINLQRMFNLREGFSRKDDLIPERVKKVPSFGIYKDEDRCGISDYEAMLDEYYDARGWDLKTGAPSKEKLDELGI